MTVRGPRWRGVSVGNGSYLCSLVFECVQLGVPFTCDHSRVINIREVPTSNTLVFTPGRAGKLVSTLGILSLGNEPALFITGTRLFHGPITTQMLGFLGLVPVVHVHSKQRGLGGGSRIGTITISTVHSNLTFSVFPRKASENGRSLVSVGGNVFHVTLRTIKTFNSDGPMCVIPVKVRCNSCIHCHNDHIVRINRPVGMARFIHGRLRSRPTRLVGLLQSSLITHVRRLVRFIPSNRFCRTGLS